MDEPKSDPWESLKCIWTAFALGAVFMMGVLTAYLWSLPFGLYMMLSLSSFHMCEYTVSALYRPRELSHDSFMVNHSQAYILATVAAWVEYAIEATLIPSLKSSTTITVVGMALSVLFYSVRVISMVQCGSNFQLQIECHKRVEHQLVTHGLYAYLRHPSYFGWFWYSVSTQVLLANPICLILYARASWMFFHKRIEYEEMILRSKEFFGTKYDEYRKKTIVGIPYIS